MGYSRVDYLPMLIGGYDVVYEIFGVIIFILNIVEIIFIIKAIKKKNHISQIYLLNLSISDAMLGIAVIIIGATSIIYRSHVEGTNTEGQLVRLQYSTVNIGFRITLLMSIFSLLALTIDRVLGVVFPSRYRCVKRQHAVFVCLSMWVICITVCTINAFFLLVDKPYFEIITTDYNGPKGIALENNAVITVHEFRESRFYDRTETRSYSSPNITGVEYLKKFNGSNLNDVIMVKVMESYGHTQIRRKEGLQYENRIYGTRSERQGDLEYTVISILVYATIIFLLTAYLLIWCKVRKSRMRLQAGTTGAQPSLSVEVRNRKEKKFAMMAVAFVLAFVFCWLPFAIFASIVITAPEEKKFDFSRSGENERFLFIPAGLNSLINPFLYFKFASKMNIFSFCKRRR
ncbi:alpha-1A adrenergic receptor-like [Clytia hemisphaerica]|uniref:alpha-1A adrenergic receptor-like n=1 Tax=Clytia hemisphaerica TaxID=252671 RepID=UPI0034D6A295